MASSESHPIQTPPTTSRGGGKRDKRRMVMAKRGLKSLAIAVTLPLSLTALSAYIGSSSSSAHYASRSPFWFPPSWALHLTCPASSFLMGLSAWMVWADGGFHRNPTALLLYFTVLWGNTAWLVSDPVWLHALLSPCQSHRC